MVTAIREGVVRTSEAGTVSTLPTGSSSQAASAKAECANQENYKTRTKRPTPHHLNCLLKFNCFDTTIALWIDQYQPLEVGKRFLAQVRQTPGLSALFEFIHDAANVLNEPIVDIADHAGFAHPLGDGGDKVPSAQGSKAPFALETLDFVAAMKGAYGLDLTAEDSHQLVEQD